MAKRKRRTKRTWIRTWLRPALLALVLVWCMRLLFFETLSVTSTSMAPALRPGDLVLVNKLSIGARLPITLLSIPFTHSTLPFGKGRKAYLSWIRLSYFRLPAVEGFTPNTVVVFNKPGSRVPPDKGLLTAKRLCALSGDTVQIRDGELYVNNRKAESEAELYFTYVVRSTSVPEQEIFSGLGITEGGPVGNMYNYHFQMSSRQAEKLLQTENILSVKRLMLPSDSADSFVMQPESRRWNADHWGPLVLPRKGDTLHTDDPYAEEYAMLIRAFEPENSMELTDHGSYYIAKNNYYFFLGDNRGNSVDSRHFGPVPESYILGKATQILFSKRPKYAEKYSASRRWAHRIQ